MSNNVHALPVRRKAGRPRLWPMPNTPTARILDLPSSKPTLEQKLADYEDCVTQISHGLLMAIVAIEDLRRKGSRG